MDDVVLTLSWVGAAPVRAPAGASSWSALPAPMDDGWAPLGGRAPHLLLSEGGRLRGALPSLERWTGTRIWGEPLAGRGEGLLAVGMQPEPDAETEFNEWYDTEHMPPRLRVPGVVGGTRFVAVEGSPKYLAVFELSDPSVFGADAWVAAAEVTPWTIRMRGLTHGRSRRLLARGAS